MINTEVTPTSITLSGDGVVNMEAKNSGYYNNFVTVIIKDMISGLGVNSFSNMPELTTVTMSNSVTQIGNSAFQSCSKLETIFFGNKLESVGSDCFADCSALKFVTFPSTFTSIDGGAFARTKNLEEVYIDINAPITSLPGFIFDNSGIRYFNMSDNVQIIGNNCFYQSVNLRQVYIGKAVGNLEGNPFGRAQNVNVILSPQNPNLVYENNLLMSVNRNLLFVVCSGNYKNIVIPNTVTNIYPYAFCTVANATSIKISTQLYQVSHRVFQGLNTPKVIDFSLCTVLANINDYAFENSFINKVLLPTGGSLKMIKVGAFSGCSELQEINIPSSVSDIGSGVFSNCPQLTKLTLASNSKYTLENNVLYSTNTILCCLAWLTVTPNLKTGMTSVGASAFRGCQITQLTLYEGIKLIQSYAFTGSLLEAVSFPKSLEKIEGNAFLICAIKSFTLPANNAFNYLAINAFERADLRTIDFGANCPLTVIGSSSFLGCNNLTSVLNCGNIIEINESAFSGCSSLATFDFTNTLNTLADMAFYKCASLTSVTIKSTCAIGSYCFYQCTQLSQVTVNGLSIGENCFAKNDLNSITIGPKINTISPSAFAENPNLNSVTFQTGSQLTTIGGQAFSKCSLLTSITLPSTVKNITASAFYGCNLLMNILVESGISTIQSIGGVLYQKSPKHLILCPNGRSKIEIDTDTLLLGSQAFYGCIYLTKVDFDIELTEISSYCFYECKSLKTVNIPINIIKIGYAAFWETPLETVYFCSIDTSKMETSSDVFLQSVEVIVLSGYKEELFFGQPVTRSSSVDPKFCPLRPSKLFTHHQAHHENHNSLLLLIWCILFHGKATL